MKITPMIIAISAALEHYEQGDLQGALKLLENFEVERLPDRSEWLAMQLERRAQAGQSGAPVPAAAADWVGLARDRIRRELGEDILGAVTPVRLALRSALTCLGAD